MRVYDGLYRYRYVVRLGGYFGTKDRRTRSLFRRRLRENLIWALGGGSGEVQVEERWDHLRVEVVFPADEVLRHIFGIANFSRAEYFPYEGLDHLLDRSEIFFKPFVLFRRFGVRASGEPGVSARKIERLLGARLVPYAHRVDLTAPEVWCYVEVKKREVVLYTEKQGGARGQPIGTQGRVLMLFSGGIDSPVAAWRLWRSGCTLDFLYFDLGSRDQFRHMLESLRYLYRRWAYGVPGNLVVVPFMPVIGEILQRPRYYQNLLLKFFFYRVAEDLARRLGCQAIATGESLGQVSTQTLANLSALDRVVALPIFRPLLTMEKEEIVALSQSIGVFDLAYKGEEYCALARHGVGTRIPYLSLLRQAQACDWRVVGEVLAQKRVYPLRELFLSDQWKTLLKSFEVMRGEHSGFVGIRVPEGAVIIDLRSPEEFQRFHLPGSQNIPFTRAWAEFLHWDKEKKYFLVCGEGMMSALLAHHMRNAGFRDVSHLEGGIRRWYTVGKEMLDSSSEGGRVSGSVPAAADSYSSDGLRSDG